MSPSPVATLTPSPTPDLLGPSPQSANDAASKLVRLLQGLPAGACPAELHERWQALCVTADFDADGNTDAAFLVPLRPSAPTATVPATVLVHRGQAPTLEGFPLDAEVDGSPAGRGFFSAADRTGDGRQEVAFLTTACSGATCTSVPRLETWDGTAWRDIGPADDGVLNLEQVSFQGSGASTRLLTRGGRAAGVAAGPTRATTRTYRFDGSRFRLVSEEPDAPVYLFHAIVDADRLFALGDYAAATNAYKTALENQSLRDWKQEAENTPGRPFLESYAYFRLALAAAASNEDPTAALDAVISHASAPIFAFAAERFRQGFQEKQSVHAGCVAVTTYLQTTTPEANHPAYIRDGFSYGYANLPRKTFLDVCPF